MNLTRCENGHFYDAERFTDCPHCNQTTISTVMGNTEDGKEYTKPLTEAVGETIAKTDDSAKTIGYFDSVQNEPVVGWLVSIEGTTFGRDFRLKTGRNFIGRAPDMDVSLEGDPSISRDRHAVVVYEPRGNVFLVAPGDAKELFYVNDKVVLAATEISAYDVLSVGKTKLLFIPCCSDKFNWDSVMPKED